MERDKGEFYSSLVLPEAPEVQRILLFRMAMRSTPALMRPLTHMPLQENRGFVALHLFRLLLTTFLWTRNERHSGKLLDHVDKFSSFGLSEREYEFRFGPITALTRYLRTNAEFASVYYETLSRITSYLSGATRHDHSNDPKTPIDLQPAFDTLGFLPDSEFTAELGPLSSLPLWDPVPHGLDWRLQEFWEILDQSGQFDFWRRWYDGFLTGKPIDQDIPFEVASIDDEVWDKGPGAISEEIAKIETRFELEARIAELESEKAAIIANRHGVGGNMPPEPIGDDYPSEANEVVERLVVVWDDVEALKEEARQKVPNRATFEAAMSRIGAALAAIAKWSAGKADLSVDTLIKWGIPAACGYLVVNPAKLQAVFDAAKALASAFF
ncbi:MAG: hypothetical protein QNJ20_10390 [Paracoccaceae bacterium]|nr:hypothetical protein [Paracoccaceae bacterium]